MAPDDQRISGAAGLVFCQAHRLGEAHCALHLHDDRPLAVLAQQLSRVCDGLLQAETTFPHRDHTLLRSGQHRPEQETQSEDQRGVLERAGHCGACEGVVVTWIGRE